MTDSQFKQAQVVALRLLAASPKSRTEISKKLTEKGFPHTIIQRSLEALESQGLLSDRAYAEQLVSKFKFQKPSGLRRIQFELKKHGIAASLREELTENMNPEEERDRAREIAALKWESWNRLPSEKREKRVYDYLVRRGFDFSICRDMLDELKSHKPHES